MIKSDIMVWLAVLGVCLIASGLFVATLWGMIVKYYTEDEDANME